MCKTSNCHTSCTVDHVEHTPHQFVRCLIPLLYQIDQSPSRIPVVINLIRRAASKQRLDAYDGGFLWKYRIYTNCFQLKISRNPWKRGLVLKRSRSDISCVGWKKILRWFWYKVGSCILDSFGCCGRGNEPPAPIRPGYFLIFWAVVGFSRSGSIV